MKKSLLSFILLLTVLLNLSSCSEDKDNDPKPATKKEILTAKSWKMAKIVYDGQDVSTDEDQFLSILMGYEIKFNADGTATLTLFGSSPDTSTWEFASNETVLVLDANTADEARWTITELKDNSLKIRVSEGTPDEGGPMMLDFEMVYAE